MQKTYALIALVASFFSNGKISAQTTVQTNVQAESSYRKSVKEGQEYSKEKLKGILLADSPRNFFWVTSLPPAKAYSKAFSMYDEVNLLTHTTVMAPAKEKLFRDELAKARLVRARLLVYTTFRLARQQIAAKKAVNPFYPEVEKAWGLKQEFKFSPNEIGISEKDVRQVLFIWVKANMDGPRGLRAYLRNGIGGEADPTAAIYEYLTDYNFTPEELGITEAEARRLRRMYDVK